jgi:hypothetical protein
MKYKGEIYTWASDGVEVVVSTVIFGWRLCSDKPLQLVGFNNRFEFTELAKLTGEKGRHVLTVLPEAKSLYPCVVGAAILVVCPGVL